MGREERRAEPRPGLIKDVKEDEHQRGVQRRVTACW